MPPKFYLGRIVITTNAYDTLNTFDVRGCLHLHAQGDWGELDKEDAAANERALKEGGRILSAYRDRRQTKFWIITEADRSSTTILLPEDY